jgi:hypothetical protein
LFRPDVPLPPELCTEQDHGRLLGILPPGFDLLPRAHREGREIDLNNFDNALPGETTKFQVAVLREALVTYATWGRLCEERSIEIALDETADDVPRTAADTHASLQRLRRAVCPNARPRHTGPPRRPILNCGVLHKDRYICQCGSTVKVRTPSIRAHMATKKHLRFLEEQRRSRTAYGNTSEEGDTPHTSITNSAPGEHPLSPSSQATPS